LANRFASFFIGPIIRGEEETPAKHWKNLAGVSSWGKKWLSEGLDVKNIAICFRRQ
jgi:hypothetical protein